MKIKKIIIERVSSQYCDETPKASINGNIVYIPLFVTYDSNNGFYYYSDYSIYKNKYNYDDLVDEFIKLIYSDKQMFAIINNYLLDPSNETTLNEFNEMQAVRKEAKDLAKDILSRYPLE